jgi:hypothetical protein
MPGLPLVVAVFYCGRQFGLLCLHLLSVLLLHQGKGWRGSKRSLAALLTLGSQKLNIGSLVPTLLYFCYSAVMALGYFIATGKEGDLKEFGHAECERLTNAARVWLIGTIGLLASYTFVLHIYGAVKID